MPLFPTTGPLVTLVLHTTTPEGHAVAEYGIDVLVDRIQPTPGHDLDDILACLLAGVLLRDSPADTYWDHALATGWEWPAWCARPGGHAHPLAQFWPGALQSWQVEEGCPLPVGAIPIVLKGDRIAIGSHTRSVAGLCWTQSIYGPRTPLATDSALDVARHHAPTLFALALGAIAGAIEAPHRRDLVTTTAQVCGRAVHYLHIPNPYHAAGHSLRTALDRVYGEQGHIPHALLEAWVVRGNTVRDATHLVGSPAWEALIAPYAQDPAFLAGQAGARALPEGPWTAHAFIDAPVASPSTSGHAHLALVRAQAAVDAAILAHMPFP